jgi:AcrR family transcriptional regulator
MTKKMSRGQLRNTKLQHVAANLFLKGGYERVTLDKIVEVAGGSKSTIYSEFGGKCGLFVRSIEDLCREASEPLNDIDYSGLDLEQSLRKLSVQILKLITSKKAVELHRLAIGEAVNCPEVGVAWYTYGPRRTTSFIQSVMENHKDELGSRTIPVNHLAVLLHDLLTGDALSRRLAGIAKQEKDIELERMAHTAVAIILCKAR